MPSVMASPGNALYAPARASSEGSPPEPARSRPTSLRPLPVRPAGGPTTRPPVAGLRRRDAATPWPAPPCPVVPLPAHAPAPWARLVRVRAVARRDKGAQFTALLHHVDVDRL